MKTSQQTKEKPAASMRRKELIAHIQARHPKLMIFTLGAHARSHRVFRAGNQLDHTHGDDE